MKKLKKIMLVLSIIVSVGMSLNIVNAQTLDNVFECVFDKEFYYEGESINMTWQVAENYATENKMTDFEISLIGELDGEVAWLALTPLLDGAEYSYARESLYYIQVASMAEKVRLNGGEKIATADAYDIPEELFSADDTQLGMVFNAKLNGKSYWSDDSQAQVEIIEGVGVVPYEVGDITRDHEVDFFDVTELIAAVYDKDPDMIDWRQRHCITANTDQWNGITGSDLDYDYKTAELGFIDIIYLIRTIYD